jgi:hypothetical protein
MMMRIEYGVVLILLWLNGDYVFMRKKKISVVM